jgi:hypothetical protein
MSAAGSKSAPFNHRVLVWRCGIPGAVIGADGMGCTAFSVNAATQFRRDESYVVLHVFDASARPTTASAAGSADGAAREMDEKVTGSNAGGSASCAPLRLEDLSPASLRLLHSAVSSFELEDLTIPLTNVHTAPRPNSTPLLSAVGPQGPTTPNHLQKDSSLTAHVYVWCGVDTGQSRFACPTAPFGMSCVASYLSTLCFCLNQNY